MKTKSGHSCLKYLLFSKITLWLAPMVLLGVIVLAINVYLAHNIRPEATLLQDVHISVHQGGPQPQTPPEKQNPTLWIYHKTDRPLGHVITVFNRLGYTMVGPGEDWDVMWSHEYPFNALPHEMWSGLKPQQKVNHFPGSGCFTYKSQLATLNFPFIPKAFRVPHHADKLKAEALAHPEKLWIHKSNMHRGIKVKNLKNIDLSTGGTFVQEFISNPLLIDGRKFDIGVYTAITSINPLRVYTYEEEVLIRFCSKDYHPFRASDPKKYVVDDDYTQTWEIPSLKPLVVEQQISSKQALNIVLRKKGYNADKLWEQANSIITQVLLHCESMLVNVTQRFTDSRHFFELIRFDFVLDEDLKVWLMEVGLVSSQITEFVNASEIGEIDKLSSGVPLISTAAGFMHCQANLSPNLSSNHTPRNRIMYEQVLFNLLSLIGLARATMDSSMRYNGEYESVMLVSNENIQVPLEECTSNQCLVCSNNLVCQLCKPCQSESYSFLLKMAFLEHLNRRNFRRVYPHPLSDMSATDHHIPIHRHPKNITVANFLMNTWFEVKCRQDISWCS